MTTELLRPVTSSRALELYSFQTEAIESLRVAARSGNRRIILCAPTGSGKCLGEGTLILMADGTETPVELVGEGDCLMGPDVDNLSGYGLGLMRHKVVGMWQSHASFRYSKGMQLTVFLHAATGTVHHARCRADVSHQSGQGRPVGM